MICKVIKSGECYGGIVLSEMRSRVKKFYQSVILLPYMLLMVILNYLVFAFLSGENGFINNSIKEVAYESENSICPVF